MSIAHTREFGDIAAVTPSDTTELPGCVGLWISGAGDVAFETWGPYGSVTAVTLTFAAKTLFKMAIKRVKSTGTNATGIYALYPADISSNG